MDNDKQTDACAECGGTLDKWATGHAPTCKSEAAQVAAENAFWEQHYRLAQSEGRDSI